jgi:hypothetical protein
VLENTGSGSFAWDVGHDVISGNDSYTLPNGLEASLENAIFTTYAILITALFTISTQIL